MVPHTGGLLCWVIASCSQPLCDAVCAGASTPIASSAAKVTAQIQLDVKAFAEAVTEIGQVSEPHVTSADVPVLASLCERVAAPKAA